MPTLEPVEAPTNWFVKLMYLWSKRRYKKVISPVGVIYARKPALGLLGAHITHLAEQRLSLEPTLSLLVQSYVSLQNGCSFCHDLAQASAVQKRLGWEKFAALETFHDNPVFNERERAALALTHEVTRAKRVSDEAFARARQHFSELELIEIVWLNAAETYFNTLALPLGLSSDGLLAAAQTRVKPR